jgi:hypothetical protein
MTDVFISNRKSMTIRSFIHSKSKRAEAITLLDSGATENFMNLQYAKYLQLPIRCLKEPRKLYNVDGSPNHSGELQYFTNLQVQSISSPSIKMNGANGFPWPPLFTTTAEIPPPVSPQMNY